MEDASFANREGKTTLQASLYTPNLIQCLIAGGLAGTAVDTVLFPLDTLKTRLQSKAGFIRAGGFSGMYSGLLSAVIGSAPGAASFFVTYEFLKSVTGPLLGPDRSALAHMISASGGEVVACIVRVPTEVIKQRMQTKQYASTLGAVRGTYAKDGLPGFYRGYMTTVFREIPFTCIQFPLYEKLKEVWGRRKESGVVAPWEAALCGSFAGGVAAAVTTPLDVVKTRIMLSTRRGEAPTRIASIFKQIVSEEGVSALFRGIGPRVMWISIGGSIFLGVYEKSKLMLTRNGLLAHG